MKMKVGDNVRVITGTNKGKEGKILKIFRKENKVVIDGINIVKKHVKPNRTNETGGILEVEAPIHISNVKVLTKEVKKEEKVKAKEVKKEEKSKAKKEVKEVKAKKASTKKESKESK
ncbi:MAG: 50S ribosomal protein L24 [Bacilli bacterium]|nr:50S ribosomal protein L24 [Bacilli bacterium]